MEIIEAKTADEWIAWLRESGGMVNHLDMRACADALQLEIERLRERCAGRPRITPQ